MDVLKAALLTRFLKENERTIEPGLKSVGGVATLAAVLSGPWNFATLGAAVTAFSAVATGLRALQAEADRQSTDKDRTEKIGLLLSLAAREAYFSAIKEVIPRTLASFSERNAGFEHTSGADMGPELSFVTTKTVIEQAQPIFDFLENRLQMLLQRAEVPLSERERCRATIRERAETELRLIISGESRFQWVLNIQAFAASEKTLGANAAVRTSTASTTVSDLPPLEPTAASGIPEPVPFSGSTLSSAAEALPALPPALLNLYENRFARARAALDSGSNENAAELFLTLVSELRALNQDALKPLLARCLHNLGIALFNCNRRSEAAAYFDEAITMPNLTVKAKLGHFFGPFCRGEYTIALDKIRWLIAEHPQESSFRAHEAECLWRLDRRNDAFAVLQAHPDASETHYTLLSQLLADFGRFDEAKSTAEDGLKLQPSSLQLRMAKLFAELKPVFDRLHRERSARRYLAARDREHFQTARLAYEELAAQARNEGLKLIEADAQAMLGSVCMALKDDLPAVAHFDAALRINPQSEAAWANKHIALVHVGDYAAARDVAKAAEPVVGRAESVGRIAATWLDEGKPEQAYACLQEVLAREPELRNDRKLHLTWLQVLASAKPVEAKEEIQAFVLEDNSDAQALISVAEVSEAIGATGETDRLIVRAESLANDDNREIVRTVSALIHYRRGNWGEAVRRFGENGMDPVESTHVTEILICLINLDDLPGAIALAERLIALGRSSPAVDRALTHCYLKIGRDEDAEPLLKRLVEQEGRYRDRLSLFQVTYRLRPPRTALAIIEAVVRDFPQEMEGHLILSGLYFTLGTYPLSIAEARLAHQLAPDHPEVIRNYTRFIPSSFPANLLNDTDRKIIAKAMADRQVFQPIALEERDGELDVSPLLEQLLRRREHTSKVMSAYREQQLPLCFIAGLVGENIFELWWMLSRKRDDRLFLTRGDTRAQTDEAAACERNRSVVLDPVALFTLAELRLLDLPGRCFEAVYVETDSLMQLKQALTKLSVEPERQTIAHYHEGKLLLQETDPQDHRARRERLSEIVSFIHDNPKITIRGPSAQVWADFRAATQAHAAVGMLPAGSFGPALVAKSEGAAFYCDDQGLRSLATNEIKVDGFSTQALLRRAVRLHLLEPRAYDAVLAILLERNCHFVSVDRGYIFRRLRESAFVRDRVAERIIEEVGTTSFGEVDGSLELGRIAAFVWFNTSGDNRTDWIKTIGAAVHKLPEDKPALANFLLGALGELAYFPEAFIGLTEMLRRDCGLPKVLVDKIGLARRLIERKLHEFTPLGDEMIAVRYARAFSSARLYRKLGNLPHL